MELPTITELTEFTGINIIILCQPNYWGRGNCDRNWEGAPWGDGHMPRVAAAADEYKLDMSRLGTFNKSPSGYVSWGVGGARLDWCKCG